MSKSSLVWHGSLYDSRHIHLDPLTYTPWAFEAGIIPADHKAVSLPFKCVQNTIFPVPLIRSGYEMLSLISSQWDSFRKYGTLGGGRMSCWGTGLEHYSPVPLPDCTFCILLYLAEILSLLRQELWPWTLLCFLYPSNYNLLLKPWAKISPFFLSSAASCQVCGHNIHTAQFQAVGLGAISAACTEPLQSLAYNSARSLPACLPTD